MPPLATAAVLLLATAGSAAADCTCRAGGRDYQLGQRVCLSGPSGPRMAVCGMNENVSSWIFAREPCNVSLRPAPLRLAASSVPLH
ncbi:hypothetical protein [Ancylobacter mangrovi]|uniref:hypothetical protein n=1 Tax=Ancylobacter mangrovi TaxID=2972472 RepID=UPI0021611B9C|nr:hypothetical protein [Ancylobacter mangrovi]MCS0501501.1 hypothetical protein [Ancylobacter mangrovi]